MSRLVPPAMLALAAGLSLAAPAPGQTVASWTFGTENFPGQQTGPQFAPDTVAANVTVTNITPGGPNVLIEVDSPAPAYPTAPFLRAATAGTASPDEAAAVANGAYWSFTVQATAGFRLSLSGLTFDVARGGGSTPRGWYLYESLTGFTPGSAIQSNASVGEQRPTFGTVTVPLTATPYQNLTGPVEFRVYLSTPAVGASLDYDNVILMGTVTPVPEPAASLALAGAAAAGWAARRHRRAARLTPGAARPRTPAA